MPSTNSAEALEFIEDYTSENLLHAAVIRSPIAGGRLLDRKIPELPPDFLLVEAADIPGRNRLELYGGKMPFLSCGELRYHGEAVLLAAGPSERAVRDFTRNLTLAVEELPRQPEGRTVERRFVKGNCSRAFKEAAHVIEGSYETPSRSSAGTRCTGAVCFGDQASGWTVLSASLHPFAMRDNIAALLGVAKRKIIVRVPDSSYYTAGLVYSMLTAGHAALICLLAGRPVKLIHRPEEDRLFGPHRYPATVTYRTAVDADGTVIGIEAEVAMDAGAYALAAPRALLRTMLAACGAYSCDNIRIIGRLSETSSPPYQGDFGFGEPQGAFALERHAGRIAETAQLDPYAWKKRNLIKSGGSLPLGGRIGSTEESHKVLDDVVKRSDFVRKFAAYETGRKRRTDVWNSPTPLRGIGLAAAYHGIGSYPGGAEEEPCAFRAAFDTNKKLRFYTSFTSPERAWHYRELAAHLLQMSEADVNIDFADTSTAPDSGSSIGSRGIHLGDELLTRCCETIRRKRLRNLPPIEALTRYHSKDRVPWNPETLRGDPYTAVCWEAVVVEVEIDPITLEPHWNGVWISLVTGYPDPREAAVVKSAAVSEMSWSSLRPALEGAPRPKLIGAYAAGVTTPIHVSILPSTGDQTTYRGMGDHPVVCVAPAFANAISQAADTSFDSVPITPEIIERKLR